ncbi:unnamed protein product [Fusarium fujikuroi]|nr:unnamed protein product [Fusarium fujikuroi]
MTVPPQTAQTTFRQVIWIWEYLIITQQFDPPAVLLLLLLEPLHPIAVGYSSLKGCLVDTRLIFCISFKRDNEQTKPSSILRLSSKYLWIPGFGSPQLFLGAEPGGEHAKVAGDVFVFAVGFDVCGAVFIVEEGRFGVGVFEEVMDIAGDIILDGSRVVMFLARPDRELDFLVDGVLPASC